MYQVVLNGQWHCQNQFHCLMSTVRWVCLRLRRSTAPRTMNSWISVGCTTIGRASSHIVISAGHSHTSLFIRSRTTQWNDRMREILLFIFRKFFEMLCDACILRILPLVHVVYYFTAVVSDMRVLAPVDRSACVRYEFGDREKERHYKRLMRLIQSTLQQTQMKISSESLRFIRCNNQSSTIGKLICRLC